MSRAVAPKTFFSGRSKDTATKLFGGHRRTLRRLGDLAASSSATETERTVQGTCSKCVKKPTSFHCKSDKTLKCFATSSAGTVSGGVVGVQKLSGFKASQ